MNFSNFFRNIFGIPDTRFTDIPGGRPNESVPNRDEFRKPIWNLDDEDEDDDDFRSPPTSAFGFQIFINPIEMHRFFEHQMGEIISSFQNSMLDMPPNFEENVFPALESPEGVPDKDSTPECLGDKYLKPGYWSRAQSRLPSDEDLDERVQKGGIDTILLEPKQGPGNAHNPSRELQSRVFGRSVITQTIRQPDGTVEHHRTVRDNQGNEKTTVTRQFGDQSYTVTTQLDPSGVQKRTENYVNIDEGNLSDFEKKWKEQVGLLLINPGEDCKPHQKPHNWFPFDKFF